MRFLPACTLLICLLLSACDVLDSPTLYSCSLKGEIFRYKEGARVGSIEEQEVQVKLQIFRWRQHLLLDGVELIPEMKNADLILDKKNTNPVERYYYTETIQRETKEKRITSLVINTVSGDARVFHHRWIPPVEWRDSDQYLLKGNCKK
jgi:hypothetical protein